MSVRPITPDGLVTVLADRIAETPADGWLRVAVDGAPAADPGSLAQSLVDPLRLRGRPVQRVSTMDYLRPASLRLEHGRRDPDSYYQDWFDLGGLRREVLDPLEPGGSGRVLPVLWDAERDRAHRADYRTLEPRGVLLVDGALLLGHGLRWDITVHLALSSAALRRRTPEPEHWTLPAFARYDEEVRPASVADVVIRTDHPTRPALVTG